MRTFTKEAFTTPASDKQIRAIISINTQYNIKGIQYPTTKLFSKAHACMIMDMLNELIPDAAKRDFDRDLYYRLYDRFAARYPENHMTVPVRNYKTSGEDIPDAPETPSAQPTWAEKQAAVRQSVFLNSLYNSFIKVD